MKAATWIEGNQPKIRGERSSLIVSSFEHFIEIMDLSKDTYRALLRLNREVH